MTATAVEDDIRGVLQGILPAGVRQVALGRDAPLRAAGLDSLRTMELVTALEDRFAIRFEEDDLRDEYFASVAGLCALVSSKRGG